MRRSWPTGRGEVFAALGIEETENEARYRRAACLLADIGWRAHPDYRGAQSMNIISHGAFIGIDHPGRAYMALANFYRHEGLIDDALSPEIRQLAPQRLFERAKLLGALMRVVYLYSAAMPGVIPRLDFTAGRDRRLSPAWCRRSSPIWRASGRRRGCSSLPSWRAGRCGRWWVKSAPRRLPACL